LRTSVLYIVGGQNVILYLNEPGKNLLASPEGCPIEVGVQVTEPFTHEGKLMSSSTSGGRVATTFHMGSYDQLKLAHHAIYQWSVDNHHTLAGPNWEIYGDWSDQPDQLRTDVFYLLYEDAKR
jgi:effector-binding domain-containing protein